jgi:hypothetical protein
LREDSNEKVMQEMKMKITNQLKVGVNKSRQVNVTEMYCFMKTILSNVVGKVILRACQAVKAVKYLNTFDLV